MKKLIILLLFATANIGFAQSVTASSVPNGNEKQAIVENNAIATIIKLGNTDNQTMKHLDILSNRFGGRLLGSDAYSNAADWCEYVFKKWGLEVIREEAGELPVGFNRGPWFGKMISEDGMALHFVTPSYTAGTKGVQRGHVVKEPKTSEEFSRMKGQIKGAWVLIGGKNEGWPIDYSAKGDAERAKIIKQNDSNSKANREIALSNRKIREQKENLAKQIKDNPSNKAKLQKQLDALKEQDMLPVKDVPALFYKEMKEAGMLGIIQSASVPIRALYDRKNIDDMTFDSLPTIPDIKLDETQYDIIAKKVERREYVLLEFDIRNHFKMGPVKYHNIIGVIKGTKYPDEYVLLGGHLDAYDVATGGVDCGTGSAVALESARLIANCGLKPKRTIMFCLWAGEEFGLLGSQYFVDNNSEKLQNISNYFNRDGGPTAPTGITVPPAMYDDFVKVCAPINSINKDFTFTVKKREGEPNPIPKQAGGSDHAPFLLKGVPTLSFATGDPKGYNFSYGEIWHTERDTYNKSIPEYMDHASVVTALVAYGLANLDHLLSRENLFKKE